MVTGSARRRLWAGLAVVAGAMGVVAWVNPHAPPFSGRWAWLEAMAFEQFGPSGGAWVWFSASALLVTAAFFGRD